MTKLHIRQHLREVAKEIIIGLYATIHNHYYEAVMQAEKRYFCRTNFFELRGDINQIRAQEIMLENAGRKVTAVGLYRYVDTEADYIEALKLFYKEGPPGWSHYFRDMLRYGICETEEKCFKMIDEKVNRGEPI